MGSVNGMIPAPCINSVLVTSALNFLDPFDRVTEYLPWRQGMTLHACVPPVLNVPAELDVVPVLNGRLLTLHEAECVTLLPCDSVTWAVVPRGGGGGGGKNPIATVAMLAVVVGAMAFGPALGGPLAAMWNSSALATGAPFLTNAMASTLGTGLILGIGGGVVSMLSNPVIPAAAALGGVSSAAAAMDESPTYGWNPANPTSNGRPVAVALGTCTLVRPFKMAQFVTTDGDKQYLNMLFACSEGGDEGEVTVSDVRIEGNPPENYEGVQVVISPGTADQDVIPAFADAVFERGVSQKLSASRWATVEGNGNNIQGVGFGLSAPSGLWYANEKGGLSKVSVTVEMERAPVDTEDWVALGTVTLTAAQRTAVRRYVQHDSAAGEWRYRARLTAEPPTGSRYSTDVWWEYVHEIVPDDFCYPNTVLVAIKALATDQLSGAAPEVTCTVSRPVAPLPASDGTTVSRSLANPAWAALFLLLHKRFGGRVPASRVLLEEFESAAEWCDAKGISGSLYIDSRMTLKGALELFGTYGRFSVVPRGTRIGCYSDRPAALPDQGFIAGEGNIISGSLGVKAMSVKDRADAIEVTWYHPEQGRKVLTRRSPFYHSMTTRAPITKSETLACCNSFEQAWKYAGYRLNCNRYIMQTLELTASHDAIHVRHGDVLQVPVDSVTYDQSCRVLRVVSATQLRLSKPVRLTGGAAHKLVIRHGDVVHPDTGRELVEEVALQVTGADVETEVVTLAAPLEHTPMEGVVCAIGLVNRRLPWFRVTRIGRSHNGRRAIECLEYAPEVYEDEGEVPAVDEPAFVSTAKGLQLSYMQMEEDGLTKALPHITWRGNAVVWNIFVRRVGGSTTAWRLLGTTKETEYTLRGLANGYIWRIAVTQTMVPGDGAVVDVDVTSDLLTMGTIRPLNSAQPDGSIVPLYTEIDGEIIQIMEAF
ncbi:phage tail protein [Desulfovibrio mangrovi]|uniref:TipJ family phage tail tip protein n=1 Tax=Desulfovibrio mangrovi TaxID=2976983 RepID=UPI002247CD75|nr:phage tail protein [Desulfovibrio mangrovi]UZP67705.1 phage tail protein [Desulfovibrio mangrovi]